MPKKVFENGTTQDYTRLRRVMHIYHHELEDVGARFCLTFVKAFDNDDEPVTALKFAGGTAIALVRLVNLEKRLRVPFEAEIKIDSFLWEEKTEREKDAILDHELAHVKVVTDAHGQPLTADDNRPKLKLVPDDIVITGMLSVIQHFGRDAGEYQSLSRAMEAAAATLAEMLAPATPTPAQPAQTEA
jgi:hypothetical protein